MNVDTDLESLAADQHAALEAWGRYALMRKQYENYQATGGQLREAKHNLEDALVKVGMQQWIP